MAPPVQALFAAGLLLLASGLSAGCQSATTCWHSAFGHQAPTESLVVPAASGVQHEPGPEQPRAAQSAVQPAAFHQSEEITAAPIGMSDPLFAAQSELTLDPFVDEVLARNASLQAMSAAWRAAAQRYPQVVSLEDPMFSSMLAPGSLDSAQVESAYALQGSQKFPWPGKRNARGRAAQAEASAALLDVQDTRLAVAAAAQLAFFDYYLVGRERALLGGNLEAMRQFREAARTRYESNLATQQDVLQADLELVELDRRKLELGRMQRVALARINTLLRRAPDRPIPPPPASLPPAGKPPAVDTLVPLAIGQRPDLAALAARAQAEEAAITVASKDFYPDVEVVGRYDTFWQPANTQGELRGQIGVNMNMPIYRERRRAALREAEFRASQRRAEYQQRLTDVQFEVHEAYEQLAESFYVVRLYASKVLPTAGQNVEAARANYDAGKSDFLTLILSQRQLIAAREKHEQAIADYHRRSAELQRVIGGPVPATADKR